MTKTNDNLKAAFGGESQAFRKYSLFAKKADEEGFTQVAKLFRAVAQAEVIHAVSHFKAAGELKSTAENLQAAIAGENYEVVTMYPPMLAEAEASNEKTGARSFRWALEVEKIHEALYRKAAEMLGKEVPAVDYYVCPVCGYTHEGPMQDKCPVCNTPAEKFTKID